MPHIAATSGGVSFVRSGAMRPRALAGIAYEATTDWVPNWNDREVQIGPEWACRLCATRSR